jgi:hypothetical protein
VVSEGVQVTSVPSSPETSPKQEKGKRKKENKDLMSLVGYIDPHSKYDGIDQSINQSINYENHRKKSPLSAVRCPLPARWPMQFNTIQYPYQGEISVPYSRRS